MDYQSIEELLPQSNASIYKLVILASRRAIEIAEGMPKLVEGMSSERPATIALEEIRQKKVELKQSCRQEKKQEAKQEKKAKSKND